MWNTSASCPRLRVEWVWGLEIGTHFFRRTRRFLVRGHLILPAGAAAAGLAAEQKKHELFQTVFDELLAAEGRGGFAPQDTPVLRVGRYVEPAGGLVHDTLHQLAALLRGGDEQLVEFFHQRRSAPERKYPQLCPVMAVAVQNMELARAEKGDLPLLEFVEVVFCVNVGTAQRRVLKLPEIVALALKGVVLADLQPGGVHHPVDPDHVPQRNMLVIFHFCVLFYKFLCPSLYCNPAGQQIQ